MDTKLVKILFHHSRGYVRPVDPNSTSEALGTIDLSSYNRTTGIKHEYLGADQELVKLYEEYQGFRGGELPWSFVSRTIRCAHRLIPDIKQFILCQQGNDELNRPTRQYLTEILTFITCGHQAMSPMTAQDVLYPDKSTHNTSLTGQDAQVATEREKHLLQQIANVCQPNQSYIALWLMHPNGFNNMLETFNLLFGRLPEINFYY